MRSAILYASNSLPDNDASRTVTIGDQTFEGVSTHCAVKVHGQFIRNPNYYEGVAGYACGRGRALLGAEWLWRQGCGWLEVKTPSLLRSRLPLIVLAPMG